MTQSNKLIHRQLWKQLNQLSTPSKKEIIEEILIYIGLVVVFTSPLWLSILSQLLAQ